MPTHFRGKKGHCFYCSLLWVLFLYTLCKEFLKRTFRRRQRLAVSFRESRLSVTAVPESHQSPCVCVCAKGRSASPIRHQYLSASWCGLDVFSFITGAHLLHPSFCKKATQSNTLYFLHTMSHILSSHTNATAVGACRMNEFIDTYIRCDSTLRWKSELPVIKRHNRLWYGKKNCETVFFLMFQRRFGQKFCNFWN